MQARQQRAGKGLLSSSEEEIVRRIVHSATPPVDEGAIAVLIYGEQTTEKLCEVKRLISRVQDVNGDTPMPEDALDV